MPMKCPLCQHENESGSTFCSKCGSFFDLEPESTDTRPRTEQSMAGRGSRPGNAAKVIALVGVLVLVPAVYLVLRDSTHQSAMEPQYIRINAGSFVMGSPQDEPGRWGPDENQRMVTLTRSFEISATEVTQGQYKKVMGRNPSYFKECGVNCPVERVSWNGAARYCNKLSKRAGLSTCYKCFLLWCKPKPGNIYDCEGYRLPTEAEWEYAARAGTSTAYYSGGLQGDGESAEPALDRIGWYDKNSGEKTHPVKGKAPNAWGLYDMSGNVAEWCHDPYEYDIGTAQGTDPCGKTSKKLRGYRGGCWHYIAKHARSAKSESFPAEVRSSTHGFRPVRTLR